MNSEIKSILILSVITVTTGFCMVLTRALISGEAEDPTKPCSTLDGDTEDDKKKKNDQRIDSLKNFLLENKEKQNSISSDNSTTKHYPVSPSSFTLESLKNRIKKFALHENKDPFHDTTKEEMIEVRQRHMFSRLTLFYQDQSPLCLTRGEGVYVFDHEGKRYLDCVNNVAHLGHSHPALIQAAMEQLNEINTNTRYHHPGRSRYLKKLLECFPRESGLDTVFFVNSGSEANDLALSLARAYTKNKDVVVLDYAYHGHTTTMMEISAYKHRGEGEGQEKTSSTEEDHFPASWVHVIPTPDTYRGQFQGRTVEEKEIAAEKYANLVKKMLEKKYKKKKIAAFFAETVLACGGQVILPPGYLSQVYDIIRKEGGGLCIADEVQTGFGRSGTSFWAYQTQGVNPDIITLGKPMANGYPLAAVVTRREIAEALPHDYFNTFAGSNLAMRMGETVLDVLLRENLQSKAKLVGDYLLEGFQRLSRKHEVIGDVRGLGMMLGVELVVDREEKIPAKDLAKYVLYRAKDMGLHIQVDGIHENVLKFKPPLAFTMEDANLLLNSIDVALHDYFLLQDSSSLVEEQKQEKEQAKGRVMMNTAAAAAFSREKI